MFYKPKEGHGLRDDPLNAIVVPRPIGWISTVSESGIPNLAPYSFFNAVAYHPPQVMFASTSNHRLGGLKDTVINVEKTGEFVVNLATSELREEMNASSTPAPHNIDEFEYAGVSKSECELVKCPRVAESPIHLECQYIRTVRLRSTNLDSPNTLVFGEVIGVHIDDSVLVSDRIDFLAVRPIGRLGYLDYVEVDNVFSMERPEWPKNANAKKELT